jgi:hypothetical protein
VEARHQRDKLIEATEFILLVTANTSKRDGHRYASGVATNSGSASARAEYATSRG